MAYANSVYMGKYARQVALNFVKITPNFEASVSLQWLTCFVVCVKMCLSESP